MTWIILSDLSQVPRGEGRGGEVDIVFQKMLLLCFATIILPITTIIIIVFVVLMIII